MTIARALAAVCLLCLAVTGQAAPSSRIEAHYEVSKGGIRIVTMSETFTRAGDHYDLQSVSQAVGLLAFFKPETIRVTSAGTITPQGLRPEHYASVRKLDSDRDTRADFNWSKHQVSLVYHGGTHVWPLAAGTQDRLSAMYQLMFLPLQDMHELKLLMYNNGTRIDDYIYHITPNATVSVPLGTFPALYLATTPEKDGKRTEIWVDAAHHFPYKLVVTDHDGGQFTQVLTSVSFTQ
ncbi:MAG TPA: DUF3108 domain-containing protein [Gallionellaceae bacterium]|nr:DUF3108 domain-containing protein [Gallionellaceae bacterium]